MTGKSVLKVRKKSDVSEQPEGVWKADCLVSFPGELGSRQEEELWAETSGVLLTEFRVLLKSALSPGEPSRESSPGWDCASRLAGKGVSSLSDSAPACCQNPGSGCSCEGSPGVTGAVEQGLR